MAEADRRQLVALLLESRQGAARHIEAIRSAPEQTPELVRAHVRGYIQCKFHLTEEDCVTENFKALAELSMSKSMLLSPELVKEFDLAKSCDGVSSTMAKMVLLFMALQRDLDILFEPMETARAETLADIGDLVWKELKKKTGVTEASGDKKLQV